MRAATTAAPAMRDLYFFILTALFCLLSVCCEASAFPATANGLPFGGNPYSKIWGDGEWQSASAGKNAVSVRKTISGPPLNLSKARPTLVSLAARQDPSRLEPPTGQWIGRF